MAYKVIILYQLYMPSYFLGTFTEYPQLNALVLQLILVKLQITNYVKRNFIHFRKAWFTKTDQ